jgi:hypothetical protein
MKLRFETHKHNRIKYHFIGITTFKDGWWYNKDDKEWQHNSNPKLKGCNYSSHQPCRTVKAFIRALKSAPPIEFILVSRWKGYNVYGKGNKI